MPGSFSIFTPDAITPGPGNSTLPGVAEAVSFNAESIRIAIEANFLDCGRLSRCDGLTSVLRQHRGNERCHQHPLFRLINASRHPRLPVACGR